MLKFSLCQLGLFVVAVSMLSACDHDQKKSKASTMNELTPRLEALFNKTKTICFGRFSVNVPETAKVSWGEASIPLGIVVYKGGRAKVTDLAEEFIQELGKNKAIYHGYVPLLISIDELSQPKGRIVVGYDGFDAVDDLRVIGYFELNDAGVVISARPLRANLDRSIARINSIAQRLRLRAENEIPVDPGNCIEHAFLKDESDLRGEELLEHIEIGFRLREFPDAHFSIYVAPSNSDNPEGDALEVHWKRIRTEASTSEERKVLADTKFFRESPRDINDWNTGYEVLTRSPDENGSFSHHDFQLKFIGVPRDPFRPYADVQFQTGVADNAAGATKTSMTDEEAIAVWDKITSTIRVRPATVARAAVAANNLEPRLPLGELAATGRTCPQTGWWEPSESNKNAGGQRRHIQVGELMPHILSDGEPSLWQKLKGERPSYRSATVWKLVGYENNVALDLANKKG